MSWTQEFQLDKIQLLILTRIQVHVASVQKKLTQIRRDNISEEKTILQLVSEPFNQKISVKKQKPKG